MKSVRAEVDRAGRTAGPACYHGGAFFEAIGERFDRLERRREVISADVLDAWFDPSPRVLAALRAHLPWLLRTSPPTDAAGFAATVAETRGVDQACVLPGGGSSDLIFLALRAWVRPGDRALLLDPTYGEYAHVLQRVIGCRVQRLVLRRRDGYAVDPGRLGEALALGPRLAVVVNPNSPTGLHIDRGTLRRVVAGAPAGTLIWVDETYVEYAGAGQSLEADAAASRNLVVCKSMSKAYALSGARAAYLCGPPSLIAGLRPLCPPWAVSLPAQVAAVEALRDPEYYRERWAQTHRLRRALASALRRACGLDVVEGAANFVLAHLPGTAPTARSVIESCRSRGLYLRDASSMGRRLGDRVLRVAVKDARTNRRMVAILADVLRRRDPYLDGAGP